MTWILRTLLRISLIALPVYLYVGLRLAGSIGLLNPGLKSRAYLAVFLVLGWLYLLPVFVFSTAMFGVGGELFQRETVGWPEYLFLFPFWIGLIIVLELLAPFLLADLVGLAARLIPSMSLKVRMVLAYGRVIFAGLVLLYVVIRVPLDTVHIRDTVERITVKGLPPELAGLTITLVSDIQVDQYTGDTKVEQVRSIVEGHRPDLLLSGGDLVTSGTQYLGEAAKAVCGLKGSLATIAVLGDHDSWSAPEAIRAIHERCDWTFLDNEHRLLEYHGKRILVTGLTHIYSRRLSGQAIQAFLASAPEADLKVLLVHQPAEQVVRYATEQGYTLVLAGHTHGGQIVLHPLGIPITPSMTETEFFRGVYQNGGTTVVVTRGVGLTLAPVRYHAPAEVTTVVLAAD